ncbi:hypothetical protein THIOM_005310 [Candidatus Thiomargarita nelsonii]|uniref:Uncharacterized protein n=1 Tax=Candidatus Thiomargarita nelsonii TaxID=1003181 RepID=A0A176RTK4_9GAMM|nr:hypothetical protein THIOM_005310 [Candidatus Thiomargarita nelsonii]
MANMSIKSTRGHTMTTHGANLFQNSRATRQNHTPFCRCHILIAKKTESGGISHLSHRFYSRRMCCVFNQKQLMAISKLTPTGKINEITPIMHDNHRFSLIGEIALSVFKRNMGAL